MASAGSPWEKIIWLCWWSLSVLPFPILARKILGSKVCFCFAFIGGLRRRFMVLFLGGHTFYDDYATARVKRLPPHSLFVIVCTFEQILRFPWEYHAVSPEKSRCLLDVQELYLIRTLSVVGFDAGGKGYIHQLPTGTMLTITGRGSLPGFV